MASADAAEYIDYSSILAPDFSPFVFANGLVTATNNSTDTSLDLATPLSKVLFDVQEIDTHIHNLTSSSALPLLEHTQTNTAAASKVLSEVDTHLEALNRSYERLEREVVTKWQEAEKTRIAATKSWEVLRLARGVSRSLALGRQLQAQLEELGSRGPTFSKVDDHRVLPRAAHTILGFRELFASSQTGADGDIGLQRIHVVRTLRTDLITPAETALVGKSQQIIREFSISSLTSVSTQPATSSSTFSQVSDAKSRLTSAIHTLYLLSQSSSNSASDEVNISLLLNALQTYLQSALTSSTASITRALATIPTLERTLIEVSARCQNILALETLLKSITVPPHPTLTTSQSPPKDFLTPLLISLDHPPSLPSYFWRSLASSLPSKVQEILRRGGVSARTLRSNKDKVREDLRECVFRGGRMPGNIQAGIGGQNPIQTQQQQQQQQQNQRQVVVGNWDREANVMVQSVVGTLGR